MYNINDNNKYKGWAVTIFHCKVSLLSIQSDQKCVIGYYVCKSEVQRTTKAISVCKELLIGDYCGECDPTLYADRDR